MRTNNPNGRIRKRDEHILFLKRVVRNPRALGAVMPSSQALSKFICNHVNLTSTDPIIELGAGTGRFTKALLEQGCDPSRLYLVELDKELCEYLRKNFPKVHVIQGDATSLQTLLPTEIIGKVLTVISGIPLINLSEAVLESLVLSCFSITQEGGELLQFTYGPLSPLPAKRLGLHKEKLGYVLQNFPPAVVWKYQKLAMGHVLDGPLVALKQKFSFFRK